MFLKDFWRSTSGNFAMMLGLGLPAILGAAAFSIDVSTIMQAKANLQNALDGANLAASRIVDAETSRQAAFDQYFKSNVDQYKELVNASATLDIDRGVDYIKTRATASADVALNFPFLFGGEKHIVVDAGAMESAESLEVVLVLDNTGSMQTNNRIGKLREATDGLIEQLKKMKAAAPWRNIRGALVPFVTAVNVNGEEFDPGWIDLDGKASLNGANFTVNGKKVTDNMKLFAALQADKPDSQKTGWKKTGWKGCVEARASSFARSDTAPDPDKPDTLFVPYLAPDDPGNASTSQASLPDSATGYNNSYLDDAVDKNKLATANLSILGIDLGGLFGLLGLDTLSPVLKYIASNNKVVFDAGPRTSSPNYACPTPIVPLTSDLDKLDAEAAKMIQWNGSGTNVSEGLAWGMRVLSPGAPYTDGAAFKAEGTKKVIVLLTDGTNEVFGASSTTDHKSDYTSYGYLSSGRFDGATTKAAAVTKVDGWTKDLCTQLKNQGVDIYTVLLQADTTSNRKLYTDCASTPANFFLTNDVNALPDTFLKIMDSITQLRLTN